MRHATTIGALPAAALLCLAVAWQPGRCLAQRGPLTVSVDPETFFDDDPAWTLGLRPAVGWDTKRDVYPLLGVSGGYAFPNHFHMGGLLAVRPDGPQHIKLALRHGVWFRQKAVSFATGTSVGFLWEPENDDIGFLPTWWFDIRIRVAPSNYLTLFGEADLKFRDLGFDRTETLLSGGLGWTLAF